MKITESIKRIIKTGTNNFFRNGWLTATTTSVLSVVLFIVLGLILLSVVLDTSLNELKNRVDISIYFKKGTEESKILEVREFLLAMPEVKEIEYISEDKALEIFREKHKDDKTVLESLDVIGENPLEASLNIKAKDPSQFKIIVNKIENNDKYKPLIKKINYYENKQLIDKLNNLISSIKKGGFFISLVMLVIAFLVAFNTIRITIYTMRDEIGVMKLVGAANWFIRGPFLVEGILYGFVSSVVTVLVALPILYFSNAFLSGFFVGINVFEYYITNIFQIWFILFLIAGTVSILGSVVSMQKYLKV